MFKSSQQLSTEIQTVVSEVSAEEQRYRRAMLALEQRKVALIKQGRGHYRKVAANHREQACAFLEAAAQRLDAVGPAPTEPTFADLDASGDLVAHFEAHEAYKAAKAAHEKAATEAAQPLLVQMPAVHRLASNASRECRELGFGGDDFHLGVGVVPEHVHRHQAGTAKLETILRRAHAGALTGDECRAMIALLKTPEPEHNSLVNGNVRYVRDDQVAPTGPWITRKWREVADGIERLGAGEDGVEGK